jgi:hypothetical protein
MVGGNQQVEELAQHKAELWGGMLALIEPLTLPPPPHHPPYALQIFLRQIHFIFAERSGTKTADYYLEKFVMAFLTRGITNTLQSLLFINAWINYCTELD